MDRNELDQALAAARDTIPAMWFALYRGAVAAGFNQSQAFALLQTWVLGQNPNGIRPPSESGPKPEEPT